MTSSSTSLPVQADFLVIGGGIAGASVAHWLAPHGRVIVLEREAQPGYHSTGRSAALFMESYGTPQVRALTMASRAFLQHPPAGFSEHPLLTPRGAMMVARPEQAAALEAHWQVLHAMSPDAAASAPKRPAPWCRCCGPSWCIGAVFEPDASDMDVHAIHQGYLRGMRRSGGTLACNAEVTAMRARGGRLAASTPAARGTRRRWCSTPPAPGST